MTTPQPKPSIMQIQPYVAGKSSVKGKTDVIKLSSNENPLGPSPKAVEAVRASTDTLHRYPVGSYDNIRNTLGEAYDLDPGKIIVGAGSDELIGLLCQAYTGDGSEVLYSEHGFLMYKIYALASGATPVTAPERDYTTDVDAILQAVTDRTRIVFIANPNNPTGTYLPATEMRRLREGLREDILLVIDGAYAEYVVADDYDPGMSLVDAGGNTVMTRTFSKIYGLPALRLGWAYAHSSIIDTLNRIRSPFNVTTPAVQAGMAALSDQDHVNRSREHNQTEMRRLEEALKSLELISLPSQGNFLLVKFPDEKNAQSADDALKSDGIIVRQVGNYGLPEWLRITIGTTEENDTLIEALSRFMNR